MPKPLTLSLGGIAIALVPDRNEGDYDILRKTGDFSTTLPPDILINIHCGTQLPEITSESLVFDTGLSWYLTEDERQNRLVRVRSLHPGCHFLGRFGQDFRSGDIYVSNSPDLEGTYLFPFRFPMAELFMMNLLGTGLGLLFHAAGVIHAGRGYLFAGHGGVGKTTTSQLWQKQPGARVVNDDKVIVRLLDGEYRMYGTPWHGEGGMALPESAPLSRVFILQQADRNYARQLDETQTVALLLARCFMPLWDQKVVDFSLKFLEEMVETIPCVELGVVPDQSAVEFVIEMEKDLAEVR